MDRYRIEYLKGGTWKPFATCSAAMKDWELRAAMHEYRVDYRSVRAVLDTPRAAISRAEGREVDHA